MILTADLYFRILNIFNSKKKQLSKDELCKLLKIPLNNTVTYKKVISILDNYNILEFKLYLTNPNKKKFIIDRNKLEKFILCTEFYKLNDKFIHTSMWGAITP